MLEYLADAIANFIVGISIWKLILRFTISSNNNQQPGSIKTRQFLLIYILWMLWFSTVLESGERRYREQLSGNPEFRLLAVEEFDLVKYEEKEGAERGQHGQMTGNNSLALENGTGQAGRNNEKEGQRSVEILTVGSEADPLILSDGVNKGLGEEKADTGSQKQDH